MHILVRVIGVILAIVGVVNLIGLLYVDPALLKSPITVVIRYSFMLLAGLGLAFLLKWGVVIYFISFIVAWVSYFLVYNGEGSLVPLWATIPIPAVIAALCYFTWSKMSWNFKRGSSHEQDIDAEQVTPTTKN